MSFRRGTRKDESRFSYPVSGRSDSYISKDLNISRIYSMEKNYRNMLSELVENIRDIIYREEVVLTGCNEISELVLRTLQKLGLEPKLKKSMVDTFDGKRVSHVWVEVGDSIIETNPSQMFGIPYSVSPIMLKSKVRWSERTNPGEVDPFEGIRFSLTQEGETYFDKLSDELVSMINEK